MQSQTESTHIFTYTDSELNLSAKENYCLDVCLAAHKITFTLHYQNRIWGFRYLNVATSIFESSLFTLQQHLQLLEWYAPNYKQVRVFIDNELFTLVPDALFDAQQPETYLQLVHKVTANQVVQSIRLSNQQAVCVYAINQSFLQFVKQHFSNASINHQVVNLLQVAASFTNDELKQNLLVNFNQNFITVLHYYKNEIKFLNTYPIDADTDTVYFILSIAEQLQLPASKFGVFILGDISITSSTVGLLKKYIPMVTTISRLEGIQYPLSFREFQDQQNYLAIHTLLCE